MHNTSAAAASGNHVATGSSNPQQPMSCDSCSNQVINPTRWCQTCKYVICDACVLDEHKDHTVNAYQKAARDSKTELDKFRARMRHDETELKTQRQALERLQGEIQIKLEADSSKVQKRAQEAADVADSLKGALEELEKLVKAPLNGKNACERSHAKTHVLELIERAFKRQKTIGKQLQAANGLLDEMYGSVGLSES